MAVASAALLALLVGVSCGGDDASEPRVPDAADLVTVEDSPDPEPGTEASTSTRSTQDILVEFSECIRGEGFAIPDPDFSLSAAETQQALAAAGIDINSPDFDAAVETCEPVLAGILQTIPTQDLAAWADATVDYSTCMRENGVDLPDPDFTQGFSNIFGDRTIDATDPEFMAADAICQQAFENLPDLFSGS